MASSLFGPFVDKMPLGLLDDKCLQNLGYHGENTELEKKTEPCVNEGGSLPVAAGGFKSAHRVAPTARTTPNDTPLVESPADDPSLNICAGRTTHAPQGEAVSGSGGGFPLVAESGLSQTLFSANNINKGGQRDRNQPRGERAASRRLDPGGQDANSKCWFICPFFRRDPKTHFGCITYKPVNLSYMLQHLKRCHVFTFCPRCKEGFTESQEEKLHTHLRQCQCGERYARPDGLDRGQYQRIKDLGPIPNTTEGWGMIWDVVVEALGPGLRPQPQTRMSPYINDGLSEVAETINELSQPFCEMISHGLASACNTSPQNAAGVAKWVLDGLVLFARHLPESLRPEASRLPPLRSPEIQTNAGLPYEHDPASIGGSEYGGPVYSHPEGPMPSLPAKQWSSASTSARGALPPTDGWHSLLHLPQDPNAVPHDGSVSGYSGLNLALDEMPPGHLHPSTSDYYQASMSNRAARFSAGQSSWTPSSTATNDMSVRRGGRGGSQYGNADEGSDERGQHDEYPKGAANLYLG
ncbi:hypothetical protein MKZ38_001766 [Zalerion maritima]|uniref:C2H2-type domain-containing protein n=1 Tax=Zalerion maritima TaxID=339359 RepID=A0AAD5RZH5_9PEZI|nr:hypothetical protein MKZ38_001766 [Zalerion maritima]